MTLDTAKGWLGFRYEYSGTNLTAITSSENERIEYTYDTSSRLLTAKKIGDGNPTYSFDYFQALGAYYLSRFTNPLGEVTNFRFDAQRMLASLELVAVSETTSFLWSDRRVSQITRPDGIQTSFQITNDDVTQVTDASGNVTAITYLPNAIDPGNPRGRPVDVISDSVGLVLDRAYDPQGRLTSVANGAGDTTTYARISASPTELASMRTPQNALTTFSNHGAHGHPGRAVTGSLAENYSYDAMGNLLSGPDTTTEVSPGMGGVESRTFDADRSIATVSLHSQLPTSGSQALTLETRSDGLLKAIRRPYGGDTEFDYSTTGRVLARREKASGAWVATSFGYDALDRITSTELANGMRSELGYDGVGRLRTITSKRSGVIEETLTRTFSNGRLVSSLDSAFTGPETYAYDSAGRVSTITYPGGERRELAYDLRSRVTGEHFIDASDLTVVELTYAYDLANRVSEIRRQPFNVLQVKYTYTNGFVTQTDYGNGLRRTATLDTEFGLPATTVTTNPQSQTLESTANGFGGLFNQRASTIAGTEAFELFGIASEWRVNLSWLEWNAGQQTAAEEFYWDALSSARRQGGQEMLYNSEANRLTQVRDIAAPNTVRHTYAYDAAGFVTNRDGVTLAYDATGAIASIGTVAAFDHDLDGRPISRTLNGLTKNFRFGGAIAYNILGMPLELDLGEVVIKLDGSGNRYRHTDFRGNVLFQSNGTGGVTGQAAYRAFGRFQVSGNLGERGFAGGFEIPSLGLVVLGPRVLDSDVGRFLSQDPVFNAVNQYAYAQGNPVFFWDPTGATNSIVAAHGSGIAGGLAAMRVSGALRGGGLSALRAALRTPTGMIAFGVGFAYGGVLYNIFIAGDGTGEYPRITTDDIRRFITPDFLVPTGGGSGSGYGEYGEGNTPIGAVPRMSRPPDGPDESTGGGGGSYGPGGVGGLTFSIAISFGGAMW